MTNVDFHLFIAIAFPFSFLLLSFFLQNIYPVFLFCWVPLDLFYLWFSKVLEADAFLQLFFFKLKIWYEFASENRFLYITQGFAYFVLIFFMTLEIYFSIYKLLRRMQLSLQVSQDCLGFFAIGYLVSPMVITG